MAFLFVYKSVLLNLIEELYVNDGAANFNLAVLSRLGCMNWAVSSPQGSERLCCTNGQKGDSSRESSVIAGRYEQTDTADLQDQELARLQRGAQATRLSDDLVLSKDDVGSSAYRQAGPTAHLQRCRHPNLPDDEGAVRHGAAAIIPPRKNGKPWKADGAGAVARNEALRASRRFGSAIWRRWSGYHRRSRAETKMHCVKLLGQRLAARDFDRQVAEFQLRVAVLNGFTALGIPVTEAVG
jgi:hypothetical protein